MAASWSGYQHPPEAYDGHEFGADLTEIELIEVPKSRSPVASTKDNSFWDGREDDESLMHHDRPPSYQTKATRNSELRIIPRITLGPASREKRRKLQGWHFGVTTSACIATSVCLLNIIFAIVVGAKYGSDGGVGTAIEGNCERVNHATTYLHLLINALSSILLSASNYTMQCLSAPTRDEVDKAHAKGDWLDIGVASVRNLTRIHWTRVVLWWLLAASSIPIHLLYNSAVFKTIDANNYLVGIANDDWLKGGNYSTTMVEYESPPTSDNATVDEANIADYFSLYDSYEEYSALPYVNNVRDIFMKNESGMIRRFENAECMQAYGTSFVSGINHVLLITNQSTNNINQSLFWETQISYDSDGGYQDVSYSWICSESLINENYYDDPCIVPNMKRKADEWVVNQLSIDHCLVQILPSHCKLQFSLQILAAVIICNAVKAVCMFLTLHLHRGRDVTLVTVGDAIASYLQRPDELTKGRCLMSRREIGTWRLGVTKTPNLKPLPIEFRAHVRHRWFGAASASRWAVTTILIIIALITVSILLRMGVVNLEGIGQSPFSLGFGSIDSRTLISTSLPQGGAGGLVAAVLLANCPQAICSMLYLMYNSLLTSMLLAFEWSKFGERRKPLRVTTPHGAQRSTYYLQLPFRYSGPLLCISAVLHWVISQSIFLARISVFDNGESADGGDSDLSQVGYSCLPILTSILIGVILLVAAYGSGFRRFVSSMPVVSSCSVAIASACHGPKDDVDAAFTAVQWGEVDYNAGAEEVGHACFTSHYVDDLVPGRLYAGDDTATTSGRDCATDDNNVQRRTTIEH